MINAIGSSSPSPSPDKTSLASAAALAAELARYQRQLSDCINCSSANTPESRAKAQALSDKIAATKTQIDKATTPDTSNAVAQNNQSNQSATNLNSNHASNSVSANLGNNVNVFA